MQSPDGDRMPFEQEQDHRSQRIHQLQKRLEIELKVSFSALYQLYIVKLNSCGKPNRVRAMDSCDI